VLDTFPYFDDHGNVESNQIIKALAALAQESRLGIFRLLVQAGPTGMAAGEIGAELKIPPATLSFHLKEMNHAGLVSAQQDGRFIFYSANFRQMGELVSFLTENCCARDGVSCAPSAACRPSRARAGAGKSKQKLLKQGVKQ
jgi:ArsR family transcriptional regulator, arsenate/arsenite/antimonite-responsive transcriptional repressor